MPTYYAHPDVVASCRVTVNVAAPSGSPNGYGESTYATPVAVVACEDLETKRKSDAEGERRAPLHTLLIPRSSDLAALADDYVVWLSADASADPSSSAPDNAKRRPILALETATDPETGVVSHWIVTV